ncbi:hypothetical protein DMN91_000956 [Ooceraea biroi]|nr:hypothetical protein DMN91_000956 [Ooceraea biroi]
MTSPTLYLSNTDLQNGKISYLISEFDEELMKMSGKCMDIGCGPGSITKELLLPALGANVKLIGTDISEKMIEYAKNAYREEKRLDFEVLDIQTKNLPAKYVSNFDNVFSFYTLQWCNDIQQSFENIYRMLRHGGTMLILMVPSDPVFDIFQMLINDIRFSSYLQGAEKFLPAYQNVAEPHKHVKDLLKDIGFEVYHCSCRDNVNMIKSREFFLSMILSIFELNLDKMPHDLKEEFKDTFVREYHKRNTYIHTLMNDGQEQTLQIHKTLIIYAQKSE